MYVAEHFGQSTKTEYFLYGCCPQREGGPPQAFVLDKQHGTSEKNYAAADFFPFVISGGDNLENEI